MHPSLRVASDTVCAELPCAYFVQDSFRHDGSGRVAGAEEEHVVWLVGHSGSRRRTTAHSSRLRDLRRTARFLMRNTSNTLAGAVAVIGAFSGGEERLPGNASRIVNPRFFRFGVAT